MKVVIIGGSAGGASVAARLRRLDENAKIVILEKSASVSYATCGIPYYVGNVIKHREKLEVVGLAQFNSILNVKVKTLSQVVAINRDRKTVSVKDLKTNILYEEAYDKLVLAPGGLPKRPQIPGIENVHIFTLRNGEDAEAIKSYIKKQNCKNAVVIGAGFIGLEMVENLANIGLQVTLVNKSDQVLSAWDFEMANKIQNHLISKGVTLHMRTTVSEITENVVMLANGIQLPADIVILALGITPNITLAQNAQLTIGKLGGIVVNAGLLTSDDNIFALGDAVEIKDRITRNPVMIALAGHAHKQARVVAENICQRYSSYKPSMSTAIVKVFDLCAAATGSSEMQLLEKGISYEKSYVEAPAHATFYPDAHNMTIKLLFVPRTGVILGAQIIGVDGVDKRIDIIATAIAYEKTVSDLMELDLAYAPPFSSAKDPVHIAGMVAHNMIESETSVVHWDELEMFDHKSTLLIDVRTADEFEIRTLDTATNIPLSELRERLDEIPKNKRIIVFCQFGKLGYFAYKILQQNGFKEIYNLNGGMNMFSLANQPQVQSKPKQQPKPKQRLTAPSADAVNHSTLSMDALESLAEVPFFDLDNIYPIRPKNDMPPPTNNTQTSLQEAIDNIIEVDACGLSCPGPILKLTKIMRSASLGDIVRITSTDTGFSRDIKTWCQNKGHKLLEFDNSSTTILAVLQKC